MICFGDGCGVHLFAKSDLAEAVRSTSVFNVQTRFVLFGTPVTVNVCSPPGWNSVGGLARFGSSEFVAGETGIMTTFVAELT